MGLFVGFCSLWAYWTRVGSPSNYTCATFFTTVEYISYSSKVELWLLHNYLVSFSIFFFVGKIPFSPLLFQYQIFLIFLWYDLIFPWYGMWCGLIIKFWALHIVIFAYEAKTSISGNQVFTFSLFISHSWVLILIYLLMHVSKLIPGRIIWNSR